MKARVTVVLVVAVVGVASPAAGAATASFQGLGDLPGGAFHSEAWDISGDGSVVVGGGVVSGSSPSTWAYEAFRYDNGVMTSLGDLPPGVFDRLAYGVAGDGSVVVGFEDTTNTNEAFRWESGAISAIGPGIAHAVSADGSVVVGVASRQAFRWDNGIMTGLGYLPGSDRNGAWDVSADGSVVVGFTTSAAGVEPFRWVSGTLSALGRLPGARSSTGGALGVSADGAVVVGYSTSGRSVWAEAFRWENGVMTSLAGLGETFFESEAFDVSGDGSVIVGTYRISFDSPREAFIWTAATEIVKLSEVLTALGLDLTGWSLWIATGSSDDGLTIVGNTGSEGWIATLPADWIEQVSYALTVSIAKSGLGEWGTVTVEPNLPAYAVGRTVTLTAQPNGDNAFKKWRLYDPNHPGDANHVVTDTNNPLTLVMMSDREVVAVFKCASGTPLLPALTLATLALFLLIRRRA